MRGNPTAGKVVRDRVLRVVPALVVVTVVVTASAAMAATPAARPPARWTGTVNTSYEGADSTAQQRAKITVTVTLGHVTKGPQARNPWVYVSNAGTIRWSASGSSESCTWTSSGSRRIDRLDLFLELSRDAVKPRVRAKFAAPNQLVVEATETCTYGAKTETTQTKHDIGHPFAVLGRITAGVPVDNRLTSIRGSKSGSQTIGSGTNRWQSTWSLASRR